ncbi:dihydrodipicolinate synthase family protein [Xanthobacter dioxanivorans]|uniref:Dihydrodipicolinate synthase family protein n=1 Tax=Xanthobacter dioxanivorans TaxID=2528964 RepID=A0A974SK96_9HYPH|nr:dihydrodipicolinate synthase family protein [Xanthobacter dioxanivorans]QRG09251.1 dihydrodipicolinate synthase family protein [Xanthobacter dioxanivorans]
MSDRNDLRGILNFLPTPTMPDGAIDYDRLAALVETAVQNKVKAVTLFGSVGTVASHPADERMQAAEVAVKQAAGRTHVMIGTGAVGQREVIALSKHAEKVGADSVLVVPVTYWILNEREIVDHYRTINEALGIPIAVYNNPRLTGTDITPDILARLADLPNVRYVKESCPDVLRISQTKRLCGDKVQVLLGRENIAFESLAVGADGWTSVLSGVLPADIQAIFEAATKKDFDAVLIMTRRLLPIGDFLMAKGLARSVYAMYELMGAPVGKPPRPLLPMDDAADLSKLADLMRSVGIVVAEPARKVA